MNIDFIKWMCEKAEGFKFLIDPVGGRKYHIVRFEHTSNQKYDYVVNPLPIEFWCFYSLLLQRAIEGVNREGSYEVNQDCDNIAISETFHNYKYFFFQDQTEDQAKESALKYIYEQETKK